jgi:large subunit ribosomal protein L4
MPVVDVKSLDGKTVGQLELADDVFGVAVNPHLLHEAVRHHLAGKRAGTHKTKDKSEVSGSGKKLWKQKGTGRARIGSVRSPLWRHGGTVHGPTPRSYDYALPKKMIQGALRSALSSKLAEQKLTIVESLTLDSHKTKPLAATLGKLHGAVRTALIVDNSSNVNLERASKNIEGLTLVPSTGLNTYDLMRHDRLTISKDAAVKLSRALSLVKPEGPADQVVTIEAAPAPAAAPTPAKAAKKPAAAKAEKPKAEAKAKAAKKAAPKKEKE